MTITGSAETRNWPGRASRSNLNRVTGADLKNPIEDLAILVTCDHDNVEFRINLQLECMRARPSERLVGSFA